MKLIFVSGLSGAGKTVALKEYEDSGYYCIDNLPLQLIGPFIRRELRRSDGRYEKLAIGIDDIETAQEIARLSKYLESLRSQDLELQVLFLRPDYELQLETNSEHTGPPPLPNGENP